VATRPPSLEVSTVTVVNTDDAGAGSLRQAIADALDGATIQFAAALAGKTIVLTSGPLVIEKPLVVEGPTAGGVTISGGLASRVIQVGLSADVVLRNLSIVDGREFFSAGISNGGNLVLDHVLVANNQSGTEKGTGGGISTADGELTLVNSTVSGNVGYTGGIFATGGTITIRSSTITGNTGSQGGGIVSFVPFTLRNSIIAGNIDGDPDDANANANCGVRKPTFFDKNVSNDESCGTDPALIIADPLLGPLANNGGPTRTHAIKLGSYAIDGATQCTEATDQRYVARPQGAACDIGAYEFDGYASLTLTAGPNAAVNSKTGAVTLGGTITCSEPGSFTLDVALSQTQKTNGKFTTIVQASAPTNVSCNGTSSWSVTIAPQTGGFDNGAATANVRTTTYPFAFLPASVTAPVKLYFVK